MVSIIDAGERTKISKALGQPFPQEALKTRKGGGGRDFTYIEGHTAIHRLNKATENQWDFEVIREREVPQIDRNGKPQTLIICYGELTIEGLGTRGDYGVQMMTEFGGEDLYKGAQTDCLKRCARQFGMALELYGEHYELEPAVSNTTLKRLATTFRSVTGMSLNQESYADTMLRRTGKAIEDVTEEDVVAWINELELNVKPPIKVASAKTAKKKDETELIGEAGKEVLAEAVAVPA